MQWRLPTGMTSWSAAIGHYARAQMRFSEDCLPGFLRNLLSPKIETDDSVEQLVTNGTVMYLNRLPTR